MKYELTENVKNDDEYNIKSALNKDGSLFAFSLDGKRVSIISLTDMK